MTPCVIPSMLDGPPEIRALVYIRQLSIFSLDCVMFEFPEGASTVGYSFLGLSLTRIIFSGVYRNAIAQRLPDPILKRFLSPRSMKAEKVRKLHENLWYAVWHTLSFVTLLTVLLAQPWFVSYATTWDCRWIYLGFPHVITEASAKVYLVELGFWISCLFFMALETLRKDVVEMFVHHVTTISLVGLSYVYGFHQVGLVIMAVHDLGDIFLYSAKFFNYLDFPGLTNALFGTFVLVFFITRLVIYPQLVYLAWGPFTGFLPDIDYRDYQGTLILPGLLAVLQALHCMWFVLICRMVHRMLKTETKQVEGDIRSDDETSNENGSNKKHK